MKLLINEGHEVQFTQLDKAILVKETYNDMNVTSERQRVKKDGISYMLERIKLGYKSYT